jgi:glycosyltransferase involved in cell wall biosynthesis
MQRGLVSIMMPAYNAAPYIGDAVRSVLAQSYPDWELLVVNDGSADATGDIARSFRDTRIRVFDKENGGESSARNLALEHARGEFIAYLDADDAYFPHHLETTVAFLRSNPHRDAVYTDGFHIDEQGGRLASLQARRRGPFEGRIYEHVVRASDVFGPPICVVLRHALVASHHLRYDTRIVIGPDWDFFVRFAELGTFGYIPDQTTLYRVHETNITSQVDFGRRAGFLAICRENAIRMASFATCSVETRTAVFYDVLVPLLRGQDARREGVVRSDAFRALPAPEQARLLRLVAADAVLHAGDTQHAATWLERARVLNPADRRATVLAALHGTSPALCRALLRALSPFRGSTRPARPFGDIESARRRVSAPSSVNQV